jgi:3-hydroxyacyl-CoA dehydrogenase
MSRILVAGSGRMGRDLGLWLLRLGHHIHWISRQPSRLEALRQHVDRVRRRWQREGAAGSAVGEVTFGTPDDLAALPAPDLLLEAVEEEVTAKRTVLAWAAAWEPRRPLLLSATSSFLPQHLHPQCLVTHFFFPVEVTGLVEVVCPETVADKDRESVYKLLKDSGIHVIEQTYRQAFTVNRLLLPAHAECVRAVGLGLAPLLADQAAVTGLLGLAPLALAQRVGEATIRAALANYVTAAAAGAADYRELVQAVAAGRVEAPAERAAGAGLSLAEASEIQQAVQLNTCLRFVQEGLIAEPDLDWLLANYYGRSGTLAAVLAQQDLGAVAARLRTLHQQSGRQYFVPAERLAAARNPSA